MKKKLIIGLVVVSLLALIIVPRVLENKMNASETLEDKAITVEGTAVKKGDLVLNTELISKVEAASSVNILPVVPAKVDTIHVKVGDQVKKGDLLFTLDETDVRLQVTQAQAGLTSAKASVQQAQLGLNNSEQAVVQATLSYDMAKANYDMNKANYQYTLDNFEKYKELYDEGYISQAEFEQMKLQASPNTAVLLEKQLEQASQALLQAQLGVENSKFAITQAEAGYMQAQKNYEKALETLDDMAFKAPMDGYITVINLVENQIASNAQPAMVLDAMDTVIIKTNITENYVNKLSAGQPVSVKISSLDDYKTEGIIDTISPSSDARTLLYPITIVVQNKEHIIKPGMFATIEIATETRENALYIPNEAVLIKDDTYFVYVVKEDEKVEFREIEIGLNTGAFTEVLSGLTEKEIIVTKGGGLINEEATIKLIRGEE